jgi:hypothetical protein
MKYTHPLQSQSIDLLGHPASGVEGIEDSVVDAQPLLVNLYHHLSSQLRLLTVAHGPTTLLRVPQSKGNGDAPTSAAPQENDNVEATQRAFLARGVGPAGPGTPSTERLAHHHVVHHQATAPQLLGPGDDTLSGEAEELAHVVRSHWGIENCVHWVLDIAFRDDDSRVRKCHGTENLAILRRLALNLLRQETTATCATKNKRLKAAWAEGYLLKVLSSI